MWNTIDSSACNYGCLDIYVFAHGHTHAHTHTHTHTYVHDSACLKKWEGPIHAVYTAGFNPSPPIRAPVFFAS